MRPWLKEWTWNQQSCPSPCWWCLSLALGGYRMSVPHAGQRVPLPQAPRLANGRLIFRQIARTSPSTGIDSESSTYSYSSLTSWWVRNTKFELTTIQYRTHEWINSCTVPIVSLSIQGIWNWMITLRKPNLVMSKNYLLRKILQVIIFYKSIDLLYTFGLGTRYWSKLKTHYLLWNRRFTRI